MKLYEIPNGSKIYEVCSDGSSYLIYDHPDGMYSYCVTEKGGVLHIGLMAEVREYLDGYILSMADPEDTERYDDARYDEHDDDDN